MPSLFKDLRNQLSRTVLEARSLAEMAARKALHALGVDEPDAPGPFKESAKCAEQNLYGRAVQLVGDREPREHEFSIQLRAFDAARTGSSLGVGVLLSLCCALLQKSLKSGLVVVGGLNLGGSLDPVYNAVSVAELAIDKGATTLLIPVSSRKQMLDLPDELATKIDIQFYADAREALLKSLID